MSKYCIVEVDLAETGEPKVNRIAGPYELRHAMKLAEQLAEEALFSYGDDASEVKEIDVLDEEHRIGSSAGAFGVTLEDDPQVIFVVKELYNL